MAKIRLQALHALASQLANELRNELPKSIVITKSEQRELDKINGILLKIKELEQRKRDKINEISLKIKELESSMQQVKKSLIGEDRSLNYDYSTKEYTLRKHFSEISENTIYKKLLINTEFEKESLDSIVAKIKKEYLK